jgi:fumarate hydratase class II
MTTFRIEKDSMGEVQVPAQAYYGAQTQRAVENFPISGWNLPGPLIRALGLVKLACATANRDLGKPTKTGKNKLSDDQREAAPPAAKWPTGSSTTSSRSTSFRPVPARRAT